MSDHREPTIKPDFARKFEAIGTILSNPVILYTLERILLQGRKVADSVSTNYQYTVFPTDECVLIQPLIRIGLLTEEKLTFREFDGKDLLPASVTKRVLVLRQTAVFKDFLQIFRAFSVALARLSFIERKQVFERFKLIVKSTKYPAGKLFAAIILFHQKGTWLNEEMPMRTKEMLLDRESALLIDVIKIISFGDISEVNFDTEGLPYVGTNDYRFIKDKIGDIANAFDPEKVRFSEEP